VSPGAEGSLGHGSVTQLIQQWRSGTPEALNDLVPYIYQELHRLAAGYLRRERPDHTLQATALVNEVYLRLAGAAAPHVENRKHFYGVTARLMRQILIDHARRHLTDKRGEGAITLSLDEALTCSVSTAEGFTALDEALEQLAAVDVRKARTVELRFFTGLTVEETAEVMGESVASVYRDMRFALAFIARQLQS
jgi:RNA polymerase sigma factor (TIGR02999 family)